MSSIEIVKAYYQAFNDKNWSQMLDLVSDDVTHEPNQGDVRHGKALFVEFLKTMDTCYDETLTDFQYYIGEDEQKIAAEFTVNGIYKQSDDVTAPPAHNQKYVLPAAAFLEVSDGKVSRVATFYNLPRWIKLVSE